MRFSSRFLDVLHQVNRGGWVAACAACLLTGCAWGYAGQQPKMMPAPPSDQPKPTVVQIEGAPATTPAAAPASATTAPSASAKPASPCGVATFDIYFYTPETRIVKTIDCAQHKIIKVTKTTMGPSQIQEATSANLPQNTWYLLVDPNGSRAKYLNNKDLLKIADHFKVQFLQKDTVDDLMVYAYQDDLH